MSLLSIVPSEVSSANDSSTLRAYLDELRRLPSPGYYGCPWAQSHILPTLTNCLVTGYRRDVPACKTHDQWIDRMIDSANLEHPMTPGRISWEMTVLRAALRDHRPVFTHADFTIANIQEFTRYASVREGGDDWREAVLRFLDPYYIEFLAIANWFAWFIFGA
ncbi:hypothetical protein B0H67DRAFT_556914 [Lasiosphaeris hirsuta]|uniref:Uncharacterized protein n=1 Tax=Lasiosphaeris hirsuta TaxID=260670 RepID=A0AA40A355_9PEZI|nr:hypothetical protein B0H67DRAFT_556914 [Lasiosphaeris hirsuta]